MTPQAFTIEQAAEVLQVGVWWLRNQAVKREIPFHLIGRKYRFTQDDIDQILEQTAKAPTRRAAPVTAARFGMAGRPVPPSTLPGRPARGKAS